MIRMGTEEQFSGMRREGKSATSVERQFDVPEMCALRGEQVRVYDLAPEKATSDVPVVFGPGWGMTPAEFKESMLGVVADGRRTLAVDAPHGIATAAAETNAQHASAAELRKAEAVLALLEAKDIARTDVVGHSEAALYFAVAASLFPEKFRNLVLVNPAGFLASDSEGALVLRMGKDILNQLAVALRDPAAARRLLDVFLQGNRAMRSPAECLEEIQAICTMQVGDMLAQLREKGVGVAVIHSVDDETFPMARVQEAVRAEQVDGFYAVRGTHNSLMIDPAGVTSVVTNALRALEALQERRTSEVQAA